jgi:hypothetical protein
MDSLIVHVHIPKTGGTSLRHAMDRHFGQERSLYDYGTQAKLTSPLVIDWIYEKQDPEGFAKAVRADGYRVLSGHFPLGKYLGVLPDARFVTWMREPVARLWSAYRHYRRHHGYTKDFQHFYREPRFVNQQSRMLSAAPERLTFIGVTERYGASLEALRDRLGIELAERRANKSPKTQEGESPPTSGDVEAIHELNADDVALHAEALRRLDLA